MTDLTPFKHSIVRVLNTNGVFFGIGLLLRRDLAITCAHVVAHALNDTRSFINIETAPQGEVLLDLPFLDGTNSVAAVAAEVIENGWFPRKDNINDNSIVDLALLRLHKPVEVDGYDRLSHALSLYGLQFSAWGGQKGHEQYLIALQGRIDREIANGRYILDVQDSNYKIRPGCSGAPVIDPDSGLILGLIAQEELDKEREAGFLIPVRQLRDALHLAGITTQEKTEPKLDDLLNWAKNRYRQRFRQQADVLRFIETYRTTENEPKPFVGRSSALQYLDNWLAQKEQRFLLLSGAAGRGKSTLLMHWLAKIVAAESHIVFFLPISIRFNTSEELSGIRLLHAALCDVFSELNENLPQQPQIDDYLERIFKAWEYINNRSDQAFLLVVDGLDEAVNHWFTKRSIFLPNLPANLHVLVSARHKPGQDNGRSWLDDLNIQASQSLLLELSALEQADMAEAVVQLGRPLDQLDERQSFVDALFRLTDSGDPLLLGLWLGQIWQQHKRVLDLQVEDLQQLAPSFEGFYQLWLASQQKVWEAQKKTQNLDIHPEDFSQILHILSLARAPLLLSDLNELLERLDGPTRWDYKELRTVLESAHRLVVGDGNKQGYVLLHPRLADYFHEELDKQTGRLRAYHQTFLKWGTDTVTNLNCDKLSPDECPPYLLHHYVTHIQTAKLNAQDTLDTYYLPLLEQGWPLAWEAYEGVWQGYLNDLRQILQTLQSYNRACIHRADAFNMKLAAEVRCVLLIASVYTQSNNLPVKLVIELVREGIWSFARVVRVVEAFETEKQVEILISLAGLAPQNEIKTGLCQRLLQAVKAIRNEVRHVEALVASGKQLQGENELLKQALQAAVAIKDKSYRARALTTLAVQLQGEKKREALERALQAAAAIYDVQERAEALSSIAAQLQQGKEKREILEKALQDATAIKYEWSRLEVLSLIATQLQGEKKHEALDRAMQAAAAIKDESNRARALTILAVQLQGEKKREALERALQAAAVIQHVSDRAKALSSIATQLHEEGALLQQALQVAEAIKNESYRADALSSIAAQLHGEGTLLQQAIQAAEAIQYNEYRARALIALAARLQEEKKYEVLGKALQDATAIEYERPRLEVLSLITTQLQGEKKREALERALQAAAAIKDESYRTRALTTLAVQLQGEKKCEVLEKALQTAAAIKEESYRAEALTIVAAELQGKEKSAVLQQVLKATTTMAIRNFDGCTHLLITVASQIQGVEKREILKQALQTASVIHDDLIRARILTALVAQLQEEEKHAVLEKALYSATAIEIERSRSEVLSLIATQLQGEKKREALERALQAAAAIEFEWARAEALSGVVSQLHGESTLLQQAVHISAAIQDAKIRAYTLGELAAQFQGEEKQEVLEKALQAVATMQFECGAGVLSAIAAQLQGERKHEVLELGLRAASVIHDDLIRARELTKLAAQLQGGEKCEVLERALQAAAAIERESRRAETLSVVVSQLHGESILLQQALQAAAAIKDESYRADALSSIAAQLHGEGALLQQALQTAAAIKEESYRADVLSSIAAQLHGEGALLQQALQAAAAIKEELYRAKVLSVVVSQLQGKEKRAVLEEILRNASIYRSQTLSVVVAQLHGESELQVICLKGALELSSEHIQRITIAAELTRQNPALLTYDLWADWIGNAPKERDQLMLCISDLAQAAVQLTGNPKQVKEIAEAVIDVGKWWP